MVKLWDTWDRALNLLDAYIYGESHCPAVGQNVSKMAELVWVGRNETVWLLPGFGRSFHRLGFRVWRLQVFCFHCPGVSPDSEFEIPDQLTVEEKVDTVFAGRPFALGTPGKVDAVLPVSGRIARRHDLSVRFYAGHSHRDKIHLYNRFGVRFEQDDAIDRNVSYLELRDLFASVRLP